jgi:hypothetical protein
VREGVKERAGLDAPGALDCPSTNAVANSTTAPQASREYNVRFTARASKDEVKRAAAAA